jgi:hypothetical protein
LIGVPSTGGGARRKPPTGKVVSSRMKVRLEYAPDSYRHTEVVRRQRHGGRKMILQGTRKGSTRATLAGRTSACWLAPTLGVVMGGPHATSHCISHALGLPRRCNTRRPLGDVDSVALTGAVAQGRTACPSTTGTTFSMDHDGFTIGDSKDTHSHEKPVYVRETALRRTKRRGRFNPGRRRDYDLRFSFPLCSQRLPFLSHDARVNMSPSVAND